jgi:hypothetical protein
MGTSQADDSKNGIVKRASKHVGDLFSVLAYCISFSRWIFHTLPGSETSHTLPGSEYHRRSVCGTTHFGTQIAYLVYMHVLNMPEMGKSNMCLGKNQIMLGGYPTPILLLQVLLSSRLLMR